MLVTVRCGYAVARPPTPRNIRHSTITVEADTELAGRLLADQWTANKPGVVMPTGSEIVAVEL
jgi:hypothetical protein